MRESYKHMDIWKEMCRDNRRLNKVGNTRWWSKETSITTISRHFGATDDALYAVLIAVFSRISLSDSFNTDTRFKALILKDPLLKYESIITAQLYLRIFQFTSPLSKYLQTSRMDILQDYRMVSKTTKTLQQISREFGEVKQAADNFVSWATKELEERDCEEYIESEFPEESTQRRKIKKKNNLMKKFKMN